jgi:hypothetical protein
MDYLERNSTVIRELRKKVDDLKKGELIGESSRTKTRVFGSYESPTYGETLYVALKQSTSNTTLEKDLSTIVTIARNIPEAIGRLPFFFGLVRDKSGQEVGIVTEDFSQGLTRRVRPLYEEWVDMEDPVVSKLSEIFSGAGGPFGSENMATMVFRVFTDPDNWIERYGDFDHVAANLSSSQKLERMPCWGEILRTQARYTLKLPYALE